LNLVLTFFHCFQIQAFELSRKWGIAVRHAAFCAYTYVRRLTGEMEEPSGLLGHPVGMVRASFGAYTSEDEVELLLDAVKHIAQEGICNNENIVMTSTTVARPNDRG